MLRAMSRSSEFRAGVAAELPIILGVVPFGLVYGALAVNAGMTPWQAQLASCIVFAGSAQLVIAQMLGGGASTVVTALTAMVLNVRHVLYSASAAAYVRHLPLRWRVLLAYLLTDEAYAVAIARYVRGEERAAPDHRHWYFFGAGFTLWAFWQASTWVGIVFGAQVPASWGLDFAVPLTFIALLIPLLADAGCRVAALAGAVGAVLLAALPLKLGLFTAMLAGIAAGIAWDAYARKRKRTA